jgi:predicted dienelactone hydrolase
LGLGALLLAFGARGAAASTAPVGFRFLSVPGDTALRGNGGGKLNVVVWYPAVAETLQQPIAVGPPRAPFFVEGEAARDATPAASPARMPFVVVSHGTGGTSMDLSWLCTALATRGYLVASVDHPGNNALEPPTIPGATLWWMRAADLSRVIDGVIASPLFGPRVDTTRIGAAGFSLGGYTVLVIAGARADARRLDSYCARKPSTPLCTDESTPAVRNIRARALALAASDPAYETAALANAQTHRDARVKAVFSIAPALGPAILPDSLGEISIPVALVAGFGDPILPVEDNVIPDALAIPNAELTIFPKTVGHYTFLTDCTAAGAGAFGAICTDAGPARVAVHRATAALAASFFDRTLPATP